MVPDRHGSLTNVVLGYNQFKDYENNNPYFGAIIGRYANRISRAKFSIHSEQFVLSQNNGVHHLHGGFKGFDKVIWTVEPELGEDSASLILRYTSPDNKEGYPGNLEVCVTYTINQNNEWLIEYAATTDKDTIINLTQHSYFNLSGDFTREISDHEVQLNALNYLPLGLGHIPLGVLAPVVGTPFDFLEQKRISAQFAIMASEADAPKKVGFDHCFALENFDGSLREVARVLHSKSGRRLTIYTTEPGLQFYTANFPENQYPNPQGGFFRSNTGLCLETQNFPDAPNQKDFPSSILRPGDVYRSATRFQFACD